jgi:sugar lactone lactonase YvrE
MQRTGPRISHLFSASSRTANPMKKRILRNVFVFAAAVSGAAAGQSQIQSPVVFPGTTAVGQQTAAVTVTVTMTSSGLSAAPTVVVQGAKTGTTAPPDFVMAATAGTCAANTAYLASNTCTVNVVFQPSYPGQRPGAVEVLSQTGTLLGSQLIVGNAIGGLPVLSPANIQTVAGNGLWVYSKDGVLATSASIFLPMGVVTDAAGNLFLSDSNNNRVRRVDGVSQVITTVGGNGSPGYSGDGGPATAAMVNMPSGIVMDGAGNVYFADSGNNIIRRIDAVSGIITTVAGTPQTNGYAGDGGLATAALLTTPEGLAFDAAGDLIIVDSGNQVVRKVDVATGKISTIAGVAGVAGYNGDGILATTAYLNGPWGAAVGPDGTLYIADLQNNRIRSVNALGIIQTVAGNGMRGYSGDGANVSEAILNNPASVAVDPAGDLFVGDAGNNRVREVTAGDKQINTVAGDGIEGFGGDGSPSNQADLYGPYALYLDGSGNLFIADMFNMRIREVTADILTCNYGRSA